MKNKQTHIYTKPKAAMLLLILHLLLGTYSERGDGGGNQE